MAPSEVVEFIVESVDCFLFYLEFLFKLSILFFHIVEFFDCSVYVTLFAVDFIFKCTIAGSQSKELVSQFVQFFIFLTVLVHLAL